MATKPLRPCRHPGCGVLVYGGYCGKHKPKDRERRSEEAGSWHKLYSSRLWTDDLRPQQLIDQPFCAECEKRGLRVKATDVDHIDPHRGDWKKFADKANLQSLCHSCHSRKTAQEMRKRAPRF